MATKRTVEQCTKKDAMSLILIMNIVMFHETRVCWNVTAALVLTKIVTLSTQQMHMAPHLTKFFAIHYGPKYNHNNDNEVTK